MIEVEELKKLRERAVLVAVRRFDQTARQTEEYLDELELLVETAGAQTLGRFTQRLERPDTRSYVGKGKLEEITHFAEAEKADMIVFDEELSASQVRNIERFIPDVKILDRSLLILNIFSLRAKTAAAKTQVELAHYQYMLPRLTRMWTHLSKQKGGIGMRGPGESELETDRRIVRDRIVRLRARLDKLSTQRETQRSQRGNVIRIALVGYTNAGKSSWMHRLADKQIEGQDQLFATLDSTVRRVFLGGQVALLSDTVGFIRKLPHTLVECFHSTLEEVREADLLIHVVDASHPNVDEQIEVVEQTLLTIKASEIPKILLFNKSDEVDEEQAEVVAGLSRRLRATYRDVMAVSALDSKSSERVRAHLGEVVEALSVRV